jgi:hypothetical protein
MKITVKSNLKPLEDLARRAQELDGRKQEVPLPELLTPSFLASCSRFQSADEMFEASGFEVQSTEDFKAIPDAEWDVFIRDNTSYEDWTAMLGDAVKARVIKQLGL